MIPLILAAQIAATDPGKGEAYFSPEALTRPVEGCNAGPKHPTISDFEATWFSGVWMRAQEPSLAAAAGASSPPVWRFTVLPSFTQPMIFRISEQADGRLRMIAKRLSGKGGYDPGVIKDHIDRVLTSDEQTRLQKALASADYVLAGRTDQCSVVMDGTELILERAQAGQYDVGLRNSGEGAPPLQDLNDLLLGFAGWSARAR